MSSVKWVAAGKGWPLANGSSRGSAAQADGTPPQAVTRRKEWWPTARSGSGEWVELWIKYIRRDKTGLFQTISFSA
jgi:hypothetical protein